MQGRSGHRMDVLCSMHHPIVPWLQVGLERGMDDHATRKMPKVDRMSRCNPTNGGGYRKMCRARLRRAVFRSPRYSG